jgi:mono/diheme cytochrome c family protein
MKIFMSSAVVLAVAVLLLAVPAISPSEAQTEPAMTSDLSAGKTLFNANCSTCHLSSGAGGVHFGDAVSADLQSPGLEQTYRGNDKLIVRAILYAKDEDGGPLDKPMPAWANRLSVAQAEQIVAYLHTLHP